MACGNGKTVVTVLTGTCAAISMIDDKPITVDGWTPENSDRVYRGKITLREAFARSSNAATVRLSEEVGRDNVIRAARDLGITTPLPDNPSIALGTAGVSLLELTSAYAAVASGRYPVVARGLSEAAPPEGLAAFFHRDGALDPRRDRAPMLDLLYAAANEGTGRRAALWVPTFGKTGTTQENRDALFVGFAGDLIVGVWVGRDDNKSLGKVSGGTVPAQIWHSFMEQAMRQAREWPAHLKVAVNVSPVQFRDPTLAEQILKLLSSTGFPANRLEIEITEASLLEDREQVLTIMASLKNVGVRISLDDFGTGYASLAQVNSLPLDRIKIDKSFITTIVRSQRTAEIVNTIASLGHTLDVPISAEGVESEQIRAALERFGCSEAQGWLFGRAISADAVRSFLRMSDAGVEIGRAHV